MEYDWSTIDAGKLGLLPPYRKPPTYHLQTDPGNGCFLDPPGYPTYFTRSVYTQFGNSPRKGAETVIDHPTVGPRIVAANVDWRQGADWDSVHARRMARLRKLYRPLPFEHPRVQAWIAVLFGYFGESYLDSAVPEARRKNVDKLVKRGHATDHRAVVDVREIYPEQDSHILYALGTALAGYGSNGPGDWWERYATRPTVEECKPPQWLGGKHRIDGWCQFCGHTPTVTP